MAFTVFQSPGEGAYFTVLGVGGLLSIIAVLLRFVAARYTRRNLGGEDWFAVAAVAILVVRCILGMTALSVINGRDSLLVYDRDAYALAFQLIYVVQLITMLDQTMAKLSICCLYMRIFGVNKTYARWIWLIGGLQVVTNVALIIVQILQCKPIEAYWKYWVPGKCMNNATGVASVEPPNSIIDFFLVILAVIMVRSLKMSKRNKWKLRFLFGLGALAGVFGFIKLGVVYATSDLGHQMVELGIWAVIQSLASVVCCCAPVYKPLFPKNSLWGRLTSRISQYRLRRSQSAGLDETDSAGVLENDSLERLRETRISDVENAGRSQHWLRVGESGRSEGAAWHESTEMARVDNQHKPHPVFYSGPDQNNPYQTNAIYINRSISVE